MTKKEPYEDLLALDRLFGGLFKGLGKLIELARDMEQQDRREYVKQGEFTHRGLRGCYGFSLQLGPYPLGSFQTSLNNQQKSMAQPKLEEPPMDFFHEGNYVRIILEMPRALKETVTVKTEGDILLVSARGTGVDYEKEILLPFVIRQKEQLKYNLNNGYLEITVEKSSCTGGN